MSGDDTPDVPTPLAAFDGTWLGELAQTFAAVVAPAAQNAAEMFTVVALILVDLPGEESDGEFWPDAQQVTFTEVDPPVPERPARRERLQDWIDRSGELLEEDR